LNERLATIGFEHGSNAGNSNQYERKNSAASDSRGPILRDRRRITEVPRINEANPYITAVSRKVAQARCGWTPGWTEAMVVAML